MSRPPQLPRSAWAPGMLDIPGDSRAGDLPEWFMLPRMIGGYVTGPVRIGRSGGLHEASLVLDGDAIRAARSATL